MKLWRRAWRVQVGDLDVSNLDVRFKVSRGLGAYAGTCELTVYNLTAEHSREIEGARRRSLFLEVQAGYVEGMSTLFRGNLIKAIPKRDGVSWALECTGGDGIYAHREARVSRSFARGTSMDVVVRHIAESMGVGIGNAVEALRGARFQAGAAALTEGTMLRGTAASELTRLCSGANLTWSVQGGVLQVLPLGGALAREAILLSPDTGLVGAPDPLTPRSVKVKALLIPGLVPGQRVALASDTKTGVYRIHKAEFTGDVAGNDWYAELELHAPRPPLLTSTTTT